MAEGAPLSQSDVVPEAELDATPAVVPEIKEASDDATGADGASGESSDLAAEAVSEDMEAAPGPIADDRDLAADISTDVGEDPAHEDAPKVTDEIEDAIVPPSEVVDVDGAPGGGLAEQLERVHDKLQELEFTFLNASGGVDGLPGMVVTLDNRLKDLFAILKEDGSLGASDLDGLAEEVSALSEQIQDSRLAEAAAGDTLATALEPLTAALAEVAERPVTLSPGALDGVAMRADIEALGAAIGPVRDALAELSARPAAADGVATRDDLAALVAAIGPVKDSLAELLARPAGLTEAALDGVATREDLAALVDAIGPVKESLAELSARPSGLAEGALDGVATREDLATLGAALEPFKETLADLSGRTAALPEDALDGVATREDVNAIAAALAPLDGLATREDVAAIKAALEPLTADLAGVPAADQPAPATKDDLAVVTAAIAQVKAAVESGPSSAPPEDALEGLARREDLVALRAAMGRFKSTLAEISARPAGPSEEVISGLANDVAALKAAPSSGATKDDVLAALEPVKAVVAQLAERPDALDGLARAEDVTALAAPLKEAVDALAARPAGPGAEAFEHLATADGLSALVEQTTALREENKALSERLETLTSAVEAIARRPDPVIDLAPQRELYAKYTSVLDKLASRIEAAASRFEGEDLPALRGMLEEMPTPTAAEPAEDPRIDAVLDAIRAIAKRPDPVLDLTEQRKSFATFNTALGTALRRLEDNTDALRADYNALADRMAAGPDTPPPPVAASSDALHALLETNRKLAEAAVQGPEGYPDRAMIRDLRFALAEVLAGAKQAGRAHPDQA